MRDNYDTYKSIEMFRLFRVSTEIAVARGKSDSVNFPLSTLRLALRLADCTSS